MVLVAAGRHASSRLCDIEDQPAAAHHWQAHQLWEALIVANDGAAEHAAKRKGVEHFAWLAPWQIGGYEHHLVLPAHLGACAVYHERRVVTSPRGADDTSNHVFTARVTHLIFSGGQIIRCHASHELWPVSRECCLVQAQDSTHCHRSVPLKVCGRGRKGVCACERTSGKATTCASRPAASRMNSAILATVALRQERVRS